jgi:hypothetical protein
MSLFKTNLNAKAVKKITILHFSSFFGSGRIAYIHGRSFGASWVIYSIKEMYSTCSVRVPYSKKKSPNFWPTDRKKKIF